MRIGIVAPPWAPVPPVGYGGTEVIIDVLAKGFHAAGHDVRLITVPESTCPVPKSSILPHADMSRLNWTELELRHVIGAYRELQDFDIVHDHTLLGPVYAERFDHLQVVTTQHHPANEKFVDIYECTADRVPIVSISKAQARSSDALRIEKVIHHGIDPALFKFNAEPEDYFLFLGRMSPNKGAHRAARIARKAGVKLKIAARLCDAEGEQEYFDEKVKPLLGDGIEFVGEVMGDEKTRLIAGARGLINPILWPEPFGLVMVEALACGTPVLVYPQGAAPEIIDDGITGFLCQNEAEMVEACKNIDAIKRSDCRAVVENYFCADRMVREYLDFFEELLKRKHTPSVVPGALAYKEDPVTIDVTDKKRRPQRLIPLP